MSQFNECGFNDYLVQLDQAFSKTPQLAGAIGNLATQLITGNSDKDTPVYISYNKMKDNWSDRNWEAMGQAFQLFSTQTLKYESPTIKQAVQLIN